MVCILVELFFVFDDEVKSMSFDHVLVLVVERVEVFFEYVPFEEFVACVYDDIVPVDVAEPAVLLIQVFVDGLPVFVYGDRLAAKRVGFLEIVLAAESIGPIDGHLNFLIDEGNSAFNELHFLLRLKIMQSLHDLILFIL
jgi:hypothetical protein